MQKPVGSWLRPFAILVGLAVLAGCVAASASSGSDRAAGAAGTPSASQPVEPRTVTMVGDSLTVLGDHVLREHFGAVGWWVNLDAWAGRTTGTQMAAIRAAATRDNDATVIELGTNDALAVGRGELSPAQAEADIVEALDLFPDRCLVWVIPDHDPERRGVGAGSSIDAILTAEAVRRPNLHVADMAAVLAQHPEYLVDDRVHFTPDGYEALAQLVVTTLEACR